MYSIKVIQRYHFHKPFRDVSAWPVLLCPYFIHLSVLILYCSLLTSLPPPYSHDVLKHCKPSKSSVHLSSGDLIAVHGLHCPVCLFHPLQDTCPQPLLPCASSPDRWVLAHLLRHDAVPPHSSHVPQLPLSDTHGFTRHHSPYRGDTLHSGMSTLEGDVCHLVTGVLNACQYFSYLFKSPENPSFRIIITSSQGFPSPLLTQEFIFHLFINIFLS